MLIDEFLPVYDFNEVHGIAIHAGADDIYRAASEVDFSESFMIRWLFRLRGLSTENVTLQSLSKSRFEILGETPGREMLLGLIGRFWTIHGDLKKIDVETWRLLKVLTPPGMRKQFGTFRFVRTEPIPV